jgi:hypothetical protein
MAQARSKSSRMPAFWAAMSACTTISMLPPARKWVERSSMDSSMPDLTAVMRVSTTAPTGMFRRRNAIRSVNVALAPDTKARTQIIPKVEDDDREDQKDERADAVNDVIPAADGLSQHEVEFCVHHNCFLRLQPAQSMARTTTRRPSVAITLIWLPFWII